MRLAMVIVVVAGFALVFPLTATAEAEVPQSVVGSGGGEVSGTNQIVVGTLGQALVGVVSGPSNINEIGFWYQPGWILTGVDEPEIVVPTRFWLDQNHPNPFNPVTTLQFAVPTQARVVMKVYDVAGRAVRTLDPGELPAGDHVVTWDGADDSGGRVSAGVYFVRLRSATTERTRKVTFLGDK